MNLLSLSFKTIFRKAAMLLAGASMLGVAGCSTIDDDDSDCIISYELRFRYDYNMKWADAFSREVHALRVYAFDDEGNFCHFVEDSGSHLSDRNYTLKVDFNPQDYDIVVWASDTNDPETFSAPKEVETIDELIVAMHTRHVLDKDEEYIVEDVRLNPLWHAEAVHPEPMEENRRMITELSLVKDTNEIRVVIQQMDNKMLDPLDFEFVITTHNCHLDAHNNLLGMHNLRCMPYYHGYGSADNGGENYLNVLVAEITTSRLMSDSDATLEIYNRNSRETKLEIPLVKYLLLTECEGHNIGQQEYLDRQDEYSMTFFLDKNLEWLKTNIIINDWVIRFSDIKG